MFGPQPGRFCSGWLWAGGSPSHGAPPSTLWPHGVLLVLFVVTGGMMMRHLFTDGGVETSFVVVAALVLGALLLGRRLATAHPLPRQVT